MRGDDMPPRQPPRRGLLSGAPQAGRTLAPRGYDRGRGHDDPFAPYQAYGSAPRVPATAGPPPTGTMGRVPAVGSYTSTHVPALKHLRLGISIFHDGNPGHLWRGEFFSRLGESILSVGIVMWIAALTVSPLAVAVAVAALGVPHVLAGPLAARFENAGHPALLLKWIGRLRAVLALSLVVLHFRTIFPLLFAVLLALSFLGRIRDALRVATIRTCLAPGEPEHVANDLHLGFSFAAVAGPLLATLLFILNGERILLLSLGAVTCFALCANSETFLDTLPEKRRAFLLAVPDNDADLDEDDDDEETLHPPSPQKRREHALAEWYQQGPTRPVEAVADLRAGFGLAGSSAVSSVALWATCALALIGGGLATLEVFYVLYRIQLPAYYLGPLVAAEGAGLVLGIHLASLIMPRLWRLALFGGIAGAGVALVLMTWIPRMPVPLLLALALGVANSLAVAGARHALTDGFDGIERRALSAAEAWVAALCGVAGAVLLPIFYSGSFVLPHGQTARLPFRTYPIEQLLPLMGLALAASAVLFTVLAAVLGKRRSASEDDDAPNLSGTRARLASLAGKRSDSNTYDDADDDWGETGASESLEAWDDEDDDRDAASAAYDRDDAGWGDTGYQDAAYQDDYDDPRGRNHSRAPRGGSSARNRRER